MEPYLTHYQSVHFTDQESKDNFIVRKDEFNRVLYDLKNTKRGSSFQHYVFVGRRGSGKSTLLRRLQAEINTDKELNEKYLCVRLSEEQSGIYKIFDIWDKVIIDLKENGAPIQKAEFRDYKNDLKGYTRNLHLQIIEYLRAEDKMLILLIDNIDRIFKSIGDDTDLLRELLMNYLDIRIIGGSTYMSEHFWRYDMPFYEFFTVRKLNPLTLEEIKALFSHWGEVKNLPDVKKLVDKHPGKLQSIRMLTDGTPRTMLLFVDMLINRPQQNGFDYLRMIVDKATPIFQERLGTLSPAQQKVITELALLWDATTVGDLAPKCNMEGKTVSAFLKQLVDLSYVEKIEGSTKNHLYRVEERFFNLWLIMTQGGPKERMEAKYLTDFLENWYDADEMKLVFDEFIDLIRNKQGIKPDYVQSMCRALLKAKTIGSDEKHNLYLEVVKQPSFRDLIGEPEEFFENIGNDIMWAFEHNDYIKAIQLLQISNINEGLKSFAIGVAFDEINNTTDAEKYYLQAIEKGNVDALFNLALFYSKQNKQDLAEKYYLQAIEKGNVVSLYNLAILYAEQDRQDLAEKYYLQAIEKGNVDALNNLAYLYAEQDKQGLAEKYYLQAIEKGNVDALNNLAILYAEQDRQDLAEKYYLQAIEKGHVDALFNLALFYSKQNKQDLAEKYYLQAIEKGNVVSLYNLAILYAEQDKHDLAEKYYLLAIEKGNVYAFNNLANLYAEQDKQDLAEKYYLQIIEKGYVDAFYNLAVLYAEQDKQDLAEKYYLQAIDKGVVVAFNNLAVLYDKQGKPALAEKYYLQAIEKGHVNALNNLIINLYNTKNISLLKKIISKHKILLNNSNTENIAIIYLFLGEMDMFQQSLKHLKNEIGYEPSNTFLQDLLIHKQYSLVLAFFDEQLVEKYKSLYYAARSLKNPHDEYLLRMPPEIRENVNDIISSIKQQQDYFYPSNNRM